MNKKCFIIVIGKYFNLENFSSLQGKYEKLFFTYIKKFLPQQTNNVKRNIRKFLIFRL